MRNKIKKEDINTHSYYFFDGMINIKKLDPNKTMIDGNSYKNILICHIEYVTIKDISYTTINSLSSLYFILNKMNGYIEKSGNRSK